MLRINGLLKKNSLNNAINLLNYLAFLSSKYYKKLVNLL